MKYTVFEVKDNPVLFSLAAPAMPGTVLSAQRAYLAKAAFNVVWPLQEVFYPRFIGSVLGAEGCCRNIRQRQWLLKALWERGVT